MKTFISSLAVLLTASCASTGITTPSSYSLSPAQQTDPRFGSNYVKLSNLHDDLRMDAVALARESNIFNGISTTAATATLAFAGFEAHPDNTIASTLIGGVSAATATQLKPGDRARFRIRGMSALTCIAGKADTFRDLTERSNIRLNAAVSSAATFGPLVSMNGGALTAYTAGGVGGRSSYDALDDLLYIVLAIAQLEASPTDGLKTAMATAQESRTKLALGIKAQNDAFGTMSDAIEAVRIAIEKEEPPSITALLEAIAKIEIPKPAATPAAGSSALAGAALAGGATISPDELAVLLGFLASKVDQLTPEQDASTLRGMTACVAELASGT